MGRDPAVFLRSADTDDQIDLLTTACNNARLFAERQIDFEASKVSVKLLAVSLTEGANLEDAVLSSDGVTPVRVKKIRTPFLPFGEGFYPVDLIGKKTWDHRIKGKFEQTRPTDPVSPILASEIPFCVIQDGNLVYAAPADRTAFPSEPFTIALDVIQWLDDYEDVDQSDFLLDFAFDWLMYRAIYELNFFLKEDERVMISTKLINDAWDAIVKWNSELVAASVDDVDLD